MLRPALAVTALVAALAAPALAAAGGPNIVRVLAGPIAGAKRHHLTVLLPSTIVTHTARLYGSGGVTAKGYDMGLASAPACNGANACFVAEFLARSGTPNSGRAVALAHRLTGRYTPSACGASCNPATIAWREYGLRYAIEYVGSKRQMIALADAAIAAGPR
jgi:hypothetical protein